MIHDKKESEKQETNTGTPTSTQETGPKNQVNEVLRGDDFSEEPSHLEGDDVAEADDDFSEEPSHLKGEDIEDADEEQKGDDD